jgi:MbtH protein
VSNHFVVNLESRMPVDSIENVRFKVVLNHEEQYSLWPVNRQNAAGWTDTGFSGAKADCLAYIRENWIDMRPLSLREKMAIDQAARSGKRLGLDLPVPPPAPPRARYSLAA